MNGALTKTEFSLYSLFYGKFGKQEFDLSSVKWFFSKQMLKKIVFKLVKAGWLQRLRKGVYKCVSPEENVRKLFEPRVEKVLIDSGLKFAFSKATAAEIWSNGVYVQTSWEYKPFFIKVLKKDLKKWLKYLKKNELSFFTEKPSNIVGEFVVLEAVEKLKVEYYDNMPVESLKETIRFCEKNIDTFEYILGYFTRKYKVKTSAGKEMIEKAGEAL
ncbi:MAG: hypothetical protein ABH821_01830 [archaeon]